MTILAICWNTVKLLALGALVAFIIVTALFASISLIKEAEKKVWKSVGWGLLSILFVGYVTIILWLVTRC